MPVEFTSHLKYTTVYTTQMIDHMPYSVITRTIFSVLIGLTFLLAACDSGSNNEGGDDSLAVDGESEVVLSGDRSVTMNGSALFITGEDIANAEPGLLFAFYEVTAADTTILLLSREGTNALPRQGTYSLSSDDTADFSAVYLIAAADNFYLTVLESGQFTVTSSSDQRIDGRFASQGEGFELSRSEPPTDVSSEAIQLNGTYKARHVNEDQARKLLDFGFIEFEGEMSSPSALMQSLRPLVAEDKK